MKALRRLLSFLSNPQAYVSYISPQLLSDGSNISQWLDSLEDLALLVFGIRKFCLEESKLHFAKCHNGSVAHPCH
ncbi:hypothetical protein PSHT_04154 [Puccinia striiformis]|uniref:Uncharacterized protein n=1 Tax=Puccinia striiformis TaxID=27350 RepID=A0A2S4WDY4_9BASI|nr:hypothetical protein PSHT_04154 [Puccinia striiformis]